MLDGVVVPGVNVTEQVPVVRLQVAAENVPAPPVLPKLTVPVGVDVGAGLVSETVAVHVEGWAIGTVAGKQLRVVVVVRSVTVSGNVPLLVLWLVSPLYVPVIV